MPSFDLIHEPWIPCLRLTDGRLEELGLLATLARAHELREISDPSPLVTIALYRLLLAVVHRSLDGPRSIEEWGALWTEGRFDTGKLEAYLRRWRDRFDLFQSGRPFYQTAGLPEERAHVISKLAPEVASPGNAVLLFDHTLDPSMTPGEAARALVAFHLFAVGGLVTPLPGEVQTRSANAGPLAKAAVALVRGSTLFQTLLLNLHRYDPDDGAPGPARPDDCPAWEQDKPTTPTDRAPRGYLDYLTWQSRRIRLFPTTADGHVLVRRVIICKGFQLPDDFARPSVETMVAFVKNVTASPGKDPWTPVGFHAERALWRDSLALLQSIAGQRQRPKILSWLNDLVAEDYLERSAVLPLDLFGMLTDQANVLLWRHERLPVPLAYLEDGELVRVLGDALRLAEQTASRLRAATWTLAKLVEAPESDRPEARQPDRAAIKARAAALTAEPGYWSRLEPAFYELLVALPTDRTESDMGVTYGQRTVPPWAHAVWRAAVAAFAAASDGLANSPRTVKAVARAENVLRGSLWPLHRPYTPLNRPGSTEPDAAEPSAIEMEVSV